MFGVHSIEYDGLESFFYVFAALREGSEWLSWDHVTELTNEIGVPTVPVVARKQARGRCNYVIAIFLKMLRSFFTMYPKSVIP